MNAIARRLPAITALTVAAILAILASGLLVRMIEARSLSDVVQVLRLSGYDWARVSVDGLQVKVMGTAPSEAIRFRALTAAGTVVDSARVLDQIDVVEAQIEPPHFSIEVLRNEDDFSLIGLLPKAMDRDAFLARVNELSSGGEVVDLLESADHPVPEGWDRSVEYGLDALEMLARAKISISADQVKVSGMSDSLSDKHRLESELARKAPDGLKVALDITAPRPAITPFTLRFLIDGNGRARFDACSADTAEAQRRIVQAALAAGMAGKTNCVIGMGAPSPRWADAAVLAIGAVKELGAGAVTISDVDVSLVGRESTPKDKFDTVVGKLENQLPEGFSLTAVLPEKVVIDGTGEGDGPPEFLADLDSEGMLTMRGKLRDDREKAVVEGYAKALFGASSVQNATRVDDSVPEDWPLRVLAALESLEGIAEGGIVVQPDYLEVHGTTGDPEARANVSRLLSSKLGEGANFDIAITYEKKLDPVLGLPTAQECVDQINAVLTSKKVSFAPGSAEIDEDAAETLDKIAELMKNCDEYPMEIGGHTDSQGREEMNQQLSQKRAEAVLDALLSRRVLTTNLTARGYGEDAPIADNGTEEGREANRRIEFRLISEDEEADAAEDAGADDAAGDGAGTDAAGADDAGAADESGDKP
ncbi:OmpA family protein [Frigidibacter sp. ROC022]|uniref:OmpA family protein n=1 Tax=Frigidibacter sp. ROC022 TaxID=2971796 RepID=UPI00215A366A|nr:OmpA family protein [Frigidibacter sp. ROC022]MCR8726614.1 OmpA family protein [Frigidibacter sp. ROC022]